MYHTILRLTLLFIILLSCLQGTTQATDSSQHLTFLEAKHLEIVKQFHSAKGFIKKFIESGMMAEDVEWFVPGPKEILPFAGLWKGEEGIKEFNRLLTATMRYDKAEVKEYIVDGNQVAAIFWGEGIAKLTGKSFKSEILRLYTFKDGKIIKVRNFYDTSSYVSALSN